METKKISLALFAGNFLLYTFTFLLVLLLIAPILVIIPMSFSSAKFLTFPPPGLSLQWWQEYFSRPDWIKATLNSVKIGITSTLVATILGTLASFPLVRLKFRGKNFIYSLILAPMIIPGIIWAISEYFFFSDLRLVGNWIVIALCHAVVALPFVVIVVSASLKGFDEKLEHAAASLGADKLTTFRRITFPLIRPSILTASLFSFMISFDELLVAKFLGSQNAITLPKRMWDGLRYEINPTIPVASTLFLFMTFLMLVLIVIVKKKSSR